jgi:hydrogenase small subunit
MPGFPDKFMPFMETPVAGSMPSDGAYAPVVKTLRGFTLRVTG